MMDQAIFSVVDKMSKVLDQLNRIEQGRVLAKEHENRLRAEAIMMESFRRGELGDISDGEGDENRPEK
ncbi:hypothetical protein Y032_0095g2866 [Ancylostoma ceylanicum]|nr:hypothetical protein Y032_0095g2866 [Ancylostoma ceylanicum]